MPSFSLVDMIPSPIISFGKFLRSPRQYINDMVDDAQPAHREAVFTYQAIGRSERDNRVYRIYKSGMWDVVEGEKVRAENLGTFVSELYDLAVEGRLSCQIQRQEFIERKIEKNKDYVYNPEDLKQEAPKVYKKLYYVEGNAAYVGNEKTPAELAILPCKDPDEVTRRVKKEFNFQVNNNGMWPQAHFKTRIHEVLDIGRLQGLGLAKFGKAGQNKVRVENKTPTVRDKWIHFGMQCLGRLATSVLTFVGTGMGLLTVVRFFFGFTMRDHRIESKDLEPLARRAQPIDLVMDLEKHKVNKFKLRVSEAEVAKLTARCKDLIDRDRWLKKHYKGVGDQLDRLKAADKKMKSQLEKSKSALKKSEATVQELDFKLKESEANLIASDSELKMEVKARELCEAVESEYEPVEVETLMWFLKQKTTECDKVSKENEALQKRTSVLITNIQVVDRAFSSSTADKDKLDLGASLSPSEGLSSAKCEQDERSRRSSSPSYIN